MACYWPDGFSMDAVEHVRYGKGQHEKHFCNTLMMCATQTSNVHLRAYMQAYMRKYMHLKRNKQHLLEVLTWWLLCSLLVRARGNQRDRPLIRHLELGCDVTA
jgi:hypothetical protein